MKFFKKRHNKSGFTLVELVVVIAVLAILAGVGAVAYNGYIEYAKKGVDRKTVGDFINAIELADYADPSLFGETGSATIIISANGTAASGGSDSTKLNSALEDAFGTGGLSSAKLSYDGWDGLKGYDANLFNKIKDSANLKALQQAMTDTGLMSSYAGDIDGLWSTVEKLVETQNAIRGDGLLEKALDYVNTYGDEMKTAWTEGGSISQSGTSGAYLAASVARNYAFANFARNHKNFNTTMGDQLDLFLEEQGMQGINYTSTLAKEDYLSGDDWKTIMEDYTKKDSNGHSQAELDVLSFQTVMEAVKEVGGENPPSDVEFLKNMEPYLGTLGIALTDTNNLAAQAEMIGNYSGQNVIIISAQKNNGVWNWGSKNCVSPADANPRTGNSSDTSTPSEPTPDTCDREDVHESITISGVTLGIRVEDSTGATIGISDSIKICYVNNRSCAFSTKDSKVEIEVISGNEYVKIEGNQIVGIGIGNATISITVTKADGTTKSGTRTVEVH